MSKTVNIAIKLDANTGKIVAVNGELKKLEHTIDDVNSKGSKLGSIFSGFGAKVAGFVGVAGVIYGVGKALGFVVRSGFEANKELDASRAKLRAMISAGRDYITVSGEKVTALQREELVASELDATMRLLQHANAETAMGMSELIDVYALAKPGMDRHNWAIKDQIDILKLLTNTASNFEVSAEELSTGIDDLADGTWDASSGFGKMMKAVGVTKEEFAAAANKVEFLKERLKETGAAQDTWAVATSNLSVAWDNLSGKVTAPVFDIAKEGVKEFTAYLNSIDDSSIIDLQDALILTAKAGVKGAAYIATAWDGIKLVFTVAEVAVAKFGLLANEGMQGFSNITALAINKSYGFWVSFKNKIKQIWHDIVSYAANVWNSLLSSIGNSKFGRFIADKLDMDISGFKINVAPVKLEQAVDIVKPADFSIGIDYWKRNIISAKAEELDLYGSIVRGDKLTAADEFIKKIDTIAKKYKEAKDKSDLFNKGIKLANKQLESGVKSSKKGAKSHKDATKAAKAHNKELAKMAKAEERAAKEAEKLKMQYADIFKGSFDSILGGDIKGGFENLFSGIGKKLMEPQLQNLSNSLSSELSTLTAGLDPLTSAALGFGLQELPSLWGELLSNKLTEAEIKDGKGRSEFDSKYFENSLKLWSKYAKEGNYIAVKQLARLKSLDSQFATIGLALSSTLHGFRLDGKDMQTSESNVLFGLFSSKTTPLGSGIEIQQQSIDQLATAIQAKGYQSYKEESSSFFGLVHNESIKTNYRELGDHVTKALQTTVNKTLESVADNLDVLGFDKEKFEEAIKRQVVSLGKIDFKDISDPNQQMQVLKSAIGEMIGGATEAALSTFANPQMIYWLHEFQQNGEDLITTTSRLAVGFEEVGLYFDFFGQKVTTFNQTQELIDAAGGLEKFTSGMQEFLHGFFSSGEQKEFLQMQLQHALAVYNIALPASKAQFKALVLETQQKIVSIKAQISAMKAEIAAKVASGKMSLAAAYGELQAKGQIAQAQSNIVKYQINANNALIDSAHNAGAASVGFGKSIHSTIEAMATGVGKAAVEGAKTAIDSAGNIDYSRITSPAIAAAQAELNRLEGLYGTLMSQMGSFSSYYNDSVTSTGDAAGAAAKKFDDLTRSLISIAELKAQWTGDKVEGAELVLEATKKVTGLTYLTYDNFLEEFTKLTDKKKKLDSKTLQNWRDMSNALRSLHDAQESANRGLRDLKTNARKAFENLFHKTIAQYVGDIDRAANNKDYNGVLSSYKASLEELKYRSLNQEDYFLKAATLNAKIQRMQPKNPNRGVEERLDKIQEEIKRLREEQYDLQGRIADNTDTPLIVEA